MSTPDTEPPAFDPEDTATWPVPPRFVHTRWPDGKPRRVSPEGAAWQDGFDLALQIADHFDRTGEWVVPS